MGGSESAAADFSNPWRTMSWDKAAIEQKLRNFKLSKEKSRFVRIMVIGEVGAGKSSFINSVNNVFQGRITSGALADATAGSSFTKVYQTHYIEGKDGSPLPFVFNDLMGLEDGESGTHSQDVINAMKGFLQEGYQFNPGFPASSNDPAYRSNPSPEDQTFCLVNIIAADKVSMMKEGVIDKLKKIRQAASELNLPQVIVMTRPELACPLVNKNLRKIYTSRRIKEKMQECSHRLGVPMNHIFPVKNYHEEIDPDDDMDVLILKALDQIVNIAADALKNKLFKSRNQRE